MTQRHSIPQRASLPPHQRRTTQDDPIPRQAVRFTMPQRSTTPADGWEGYETEMDMRRSPSSTRRYLVPAQSSVPSPPRKQKHPAFYLGLGVLGAVVIVSLLFGPVGNWWQDMNDTRVYGYPRAFQMDAVVGHHDSASRPSHFIALNLHAQVMVIEFPGDDPSKARVFLMAVITGQHADRVPVTLAFQDVNGDSKPDMLVRFGDQQLVYINDQETFRAIKPGEAVNLNG